MTRAFGVLVIATAFTFACDPSKKSDDAAKDAGSLTHVTAAPLDAGFDAGSLGLTPDQKRDFDAKMAEGHKAATWNSWGDATRAFEAASAIAPSDARALSELGWSAFNAGDLAKAKTATDRAIAITRDSTVKAESLYNAGRIAEATFDNDSAKHDYEASLALRSNDTVKKALSSVGKHAGELDLQLETECVQAKDEKALCDCMVAERTRAAAKHDGGISVSCVRNGDPSLDDGLVVLELGTEHYVASKTEAGVVLGAHLNEPFVDNGPTFRRMFQLGAITPKMVAGKKTSWIHFSRSLEMDGEGPDEHTTTHEELVVICVPGQSVRPCLYPIALSTVRDVRRIHPGQKIDPAVAPMQTPDLPLHESTTVDVHAEDDGTIVCVLNTGRTNELGDGAAILGTNRLFH